MTSSQVSAERSVTAPKQRARDDLDKGIALLKRVVALTPTMERESKCASAYQRLAMIEAAAGRKAEEREALAQARQHFLEAERLGREGRLSGVFYSRLNLLGADLVLNASQEEWSGLDRVAVTEARVDLEEASRTNPDFWSVVGLVELQMYEALGARSLAAALPSIKAAYEDAHRRLSGPWEWRSVYDQLRFVMPICACATDVERCAAESLLQLLESFTK
jgi:hypothetical protein